MAKYLDSNGITALWNKIKSTFLTQGGDSRYVRRLGSFNQGGSYRRTVIALCKTSSTVANLESYSAGKITFHRSNGLYGIYWADVYFEAAYGANNTFRYSLYTNSLNTNKNSVTGSGIRACRFTYNGENYGGIEIFFSNAETHNNYFVGSGNFEIFSVNYYYNDGSTIDILNQEIFDSITYSEDYCINNDNNLCISGSFIGDLSGTATNSLNVPWSGVSSKPETATRWPSWSEVTDKPSTFTPSSHNHDGTYLKLSGGSLTGDLTTNGNVMVSNGDPLLELFDSNSNSYANTTGKIKFSCYSTHAEVAALSVASNKLTIACNKIALNNLTDDVLTVTNTSYVGIGTTSPSYKLDVFGISRSRYMAFLNSANNGDCGYVGRGSSDNTVYLCAYSGNALKLGANNSTSDIVINTSHNIGIGTSNPAYKLDVSGSANATTLYENGSRVITTANYTSYCAPASHTHSYLPLTGGTISNGGSWTSIGFNRTDVGSGNVGGVDGAGLYFAHRDTDGHELTMYLKYGTGLKVGGQLVWTEGNDGSGSGLDADLLDGTHKSALLTSVGLSASNNKIKSSITVGGTSLESPELLVPYSSNSGISNYLNTNAASAWMHKEINSTTESYMQHVILLIAVQTASDRAAQNHIDGKFFLYKTGGNVYDVVTVNLNQVWNTLEYNISCYGQNGLYTLCRCNYNNINYYALKCPYHANPFTNIIFDGSVQSQWAEENVALPLDIAYYYSYGNGTITNQEVYNSITDTLTTDVVTSVYNRPTRFGNYIISHGGFVKSGSSDSYVLLGGGGHKALSDFATTSLSNSEIDTIIQ